MADGHAAAVQARSALGWESYGAWGYKNLEIGSEKYQPIRGTNWFRGALMRATWDSRRLWALIPVAGGDIPGQAVTKLQPAGVEGRRLVVNIRVHAQTRSREMGSLRAELLGARACTHHACTPRNSQPLPGYSLADCEPVDTDTYEGALRWRGGDRVPVAAGPVKVRFVLLRARLYSFDWVL
jgi:hypothetical protein|eukprot:COSAG01_NODE_5504_length_4211_cov_39.148373_1_plen_182_part_00